MADKKVIPPPPPDDATTNSVKRVVPPPPPDEQTNTPQQPVQKTAEQQSPVSGGASSYPKVDYLSQLKQAGIPDAQISQLANLNEAQIRNIPSLSKEQADKAIEAQKGLKEQHAKVQAEANIPQSFKGYVWNDVINKGVTTKPVDISSSYKTTAPIGQEQVHPFDDAFLDAPQTMTLGEAQKRLQDANEKGKDAYGKEWAENNAIYSGDLTKLFPDANPNTQLTKAQVADAVVKLSTQKQQEQAQQGKKDNENLEGYLADKMGSDWDLLQQSYAGQVVSGIAQSLQQVRNGVSGKSGDTFTDATNALLGSVNTVFQMFPAAQMFMFSQKMAETADNAIDAALTGDKTYLTEEKGQLKKILDFSMNLPSKAGESVGWINKTPEGNSASENVGSILSTLWQIGLMYGGGKVIDEAKSSKYVDSKKLEEISKKFKPLNDLSRKIIKKEPVEAKHVSEAIKSVSEMIDNPEAIQTIVNTHPEITPEEKQAFNDKVELQQQVKALTEEKVEETGTITPEQKTNLESVKEVTPFVEVNGNKYYGANHGEAIDEAKKANPDWTPDENFRQENGKFEVTKSDGSKEDLTRDEAQDKYGVSASEEIQSKNLSETPQTGSVGVGGDVVKNEFTGNDVFYHGAKKSFDKFEKVTKAGQDKDATEQPIFLSEDKEFADANAIGKDATTMEVKVKNGKYFDFRKDVFNKNGSLTPLGEKIRDAVDSGEINLEGTRFSDYDGDKVLNNKLSTGDYDFIEKKAFIDWLKKEGYDGTFLREHPSQKATNLAVWNTDKLEVNKPKSETPQVKEKVEEPEWNLKKTENLGIAKRIAKDRAMVEGNEPPATGGTFDLQEGRDMGRDLLNGLPETEQEQYINELSKQHFSEKDPMKREASPLTISTFSAWYEKLQQAANKAIDDVTNNTDPTKTQELKDIADAAKQKANDFYKNEVSSAINAAHRSFKMIQGDVNADDLTTTSGIEMAFSKRNREFTDEKKNQAKEIVNEQTKTKKEIEALDKKWQDEFDRITEENKKLNERVVELQDKKTRGQKLKESSSSLADKILKEAIIHRPDSFMSATPASLAWDAAVKITAGAIRTGGRTIGSVTDAIDKGIEHIRNTDWYKGLSKDKQQEAEKDFSDWHKDFIKDKTPEEKANDKIIASREKTKANLESQLKGEQNKKTPKKDIIAKKTKQLEQLDSEIKTLKENLKQKKANDKEQQITNDLRVRLNGRKGNNFSLDERLAVWNYAKKNYIDKLDRSLEAFDKAVGGVAKDLGLSQQQVRNIFSEKKSLNDITMERYIARRKLQFMQDAAKEFVENDKPRFTWKDSPFNIAFTLKTLGHGGGIPLMTHASSTLLQDPVAWQKYFRQSFSFAYGKIENYETAMADLKQRPNYYKAMKDGLKNDVTKRTEDYAKYADNFRKMIGEKLGEKAGVAPEKLGKFLAAGNRGFDILKIMRQDIYDNYWNKLSEMEKADPNTGKFVAAIANHATGISDVDFGKTLNPIINKAIFAPHLEAARWNRIIVQPAQVLATSLKIAAGKEIPISERVRTQIIVDRYGKQLGMYVAAVALNAGLSSYLGSKYQVNFTNPTKNDFLKFKIGDYSLDISGGILSTGRMLADIVKTVYENDKGQTVTDKLSHTIGNYAEGKFSPLANLIYHGVTRQDFMGRPLPFSEKAGTLKKPKYTWGEYFSQEFTPIPVAETMKSIYDGLKESGYSNDDSVLKKTASALLVFMVSGATGARVQESKSKEKTPAETEYEKEQRNKEEKENPSLKEERMRKTYVDRLQNELGTDEIPDNTTLEDARAKTKELKYDKQMEIYNEGIKEGLDMEEPEEPTTPSSKESEDKVAPKGGDDDDSDNGTVTSDGDWGK